MSCVKQHNYVISLTRETKRRKHIEQEFGRQNILFSFFDAVTPDRIEDVAKKFNSLEDFYYFYAKSINFDAVKHAEIMNLLEWANKNSNFLNFSILEFVISHKWIEIQLIKDGHGSNINFNTITSI